MEGAQDEDPIFSFLFASYWTIGKVSFWGWSPPPPSTFSVAYKIFPLYLSQIKFMVIHPPEKMRDLLGYKTSVCYKSKLVNRMFVDSSRQLRGGAGWIHMFYFTFASDHITRRVYFGGWYPLPSLQCFRGIYKMPTILSATKLYGYSPPWKDAGFTEVQNICIGKFKTIKPDVRGIVPDNWSPLGIDYLLPRAVVPPTNQLAKTIPRKLSLALRWIVFIVINVTEYGCPWSTKRDTESWKQNGVTPNISISPYSP